jgi:hypothetical protein
MADPPVISDLTDALSAPLGDLIAAVGRGVAEAQQALDTHTFATFKAIYGDPSDTYDEFRRLGYRPSFYVLPETTAELIVSLTVGGSSVTQGVEGGAQGAVRLYAAPIDATYRNRFDFDLRAASKLTFKIVPVPPSVQAETMQIMPAVMGKTLGEALTVLAPLQVLVTVVDGDTGQPVAGDPPLNAKVTGVAPLAGAILTSGQTVRLTIATVA